MRPLALPERLGTPTTVSLAELLSGDRGPLEGTSSQTLRDYAEEIVRSGFPGLRHLRGRALRAQLDGYLARVVDRDMEAAGLSVRHPATVESWLRAYGAATATTTFYEKIRDAATSGVADKPARSRRSPTRRSSPRSGSSIRYLPGSRA